jgi:hypothetical protein
VTFFALMTFVGPMTIVGSMTFVGPLTLSPPVAQACASRRLTPAHCAPGAFDLFLLSADDQNLTCLSDVLQPLDDMNCSRAAHPSYLCRLAV